MVGMVKPLTVPKSYQSGFAAIRDLDDEAFREFLAALWKVPSTISVASLSSSVAAMVETIAVSDVEESVYATLFLHSAKEAYAASSTEIAERITLGMEEATSPQLEFLPEHRDVFRERLLDLLGLEPLTVIAKAGGLSLETEHSLRETRVLTDIRPIFEPDNPQAPPTGAVIIHTLKITYRDDGRSKDFFVTLDASGVRELSEQLERANAKAESLKSVLGAAQVPYIDAE